MAKIMLSDSKEDGCSRHPIPPSFDLGEQKPKLSEHGRPIHPHYNLIHGFYKLTLDCLDSLTISDDEDASQHEDHRYQQQLGIAICLNHTPRITFDQFEELKSKKPKSKDAKKYEELWESIQQPSSASGKKKSQPKLWNDMLSLGSSKRQRYQDRLEGLREATSSNQPVDLKAEGFFKKIEGRSLTLNTLVVALIEARHLIMNARYVLGQTFKSRTGVGRNDELGVIQDLRLASALSTFVLDAASISPWIARPRMTRPKRFEHILPFPGRDFRWRAYSLANLALLRRGEAHALASEFGAPDSRRLAYNDFYKVRSSMLAVGDQIKRNKAWQSEAQLLLGISDAFMGDLYRVDHAPHMALKHYERAQSTVHSIGKSGRPAMGLWYAKLYLNIARSNYDRGRFGTAIASLLYAFIELAPPKHSSSSNEKLKETAHDLITRIDESRLNREDVPSILKDVKHDVKKWKGHNKTPRTRKIVAAEILSMISHIAIKLVPRENANGSQHNIWKGGLIPILEAARELDGKNLLTYSDELAVYQIRDNLPAGSKFRLRSAPPTLPVSDFLDTWSYGHGIAEHGLQLCEYLVAAKAYLDRHESGNVSDSEGGRSNSSYDIDRYQNIARELLHDLTDDVESTGMKQAQVYSYMMRPRTNDVRSSERERDSPQFRSDTIEFHCLRRYSSFYPFVPRPSPFRSLGGGYFLRCHVHENVLNGCRTFNILIDPGPDCIDNLYRCGFGLSDIDMVIVTHDHVDHLADLDSLIALIGNTRRFGDRTFRISKSANDPGRELLVVGNQSVYLRYRHFNPTHAARNWVRRKYPMRVVDFEQLEAFRASMDKSRGTIGAGPPIEIPEKIKVEAVRGYRHSDTNGCQSYALRISLGDGGPSWGCTGDTGGFIPVRDSNQGRAAGASESRSETGWVVKADLDDSRPGVPHEAWQKRFGMILESDVLVAHVSGIPFSQLHAFSGVKLLDNEGKSKKNNGNLSGEGTIAARVVGSAESFKKVWPDLGEEAKARIAFAMWSGENEPERLPLVDRPSNYKWPASHLYLAGLLEIADAFKGKQVSSAGEGLLVIGELREELGTFRSKLAKQINRSIFGKDETSDQPASGTNRRDARALTGDIGMRVWIRHEGQPVVRVECSECALDNDRSMTEKYHECDDISELCVKGEAEGVYYFCGEHGSSGKSHNVFVEEIESYNPFSTL